MRDAETGSYKRSAGVQDRVSTIRSLCIGISAHQKLEHLASLVTLLGYESLAVFGDCFDEARTLC